MIAGNRTLREGLTSTRRLLARRAENFAQRCATRGLLRQIRSSGADVRLVLVYHGIRRASEPPGLFPPELELGTFAAHLDHLRSSYAVIPLADLVDGSMARRPTRVPIAVTFDDDLQSHVKIAAPLLREHRFPATFFVTGSALLGGFNGWWRDIEAIAARGSNGWPEALETLAPSWPWLANSSPDTAAATIIDLPPGDRAGLSAALRELSEGARSDPGLSASEIRELAAQGFEIGFHTLRHQPLHMLADAELELAMSEGIEDLERAAGARPESIAYPHGRADLRVARAARAAGFKRGLLVGDDRAIRRDDDPLLLPRIDIYSGRLSADAFGFRLARIGFAAARHGAAG